MTLTSTRRRARAAIALCAGAALLGLAGCGDGTDRAEDSPAATADSAPGASDGGGTATDDGPSDSGGATDQGGASDSGGTTDQGGASDGGSAQGPGEETTDDDPDGEDGAGADEGAGADGTSAAGDRTRIMLRTELGVDGSSGEGALTLPPEELAALLAEPFDATAECAGELVLEPGAEPVACTGPAGIESTDDQAWAANVVLVPHEDGFQNGGSVAVLFSTGDALPEEADDLLDADVTVTGVGFGSMFGAEPLDAEQLADSTLQTLTSENAYVPVAGMAQWSDVTCEDGMDFARFATVDCEASTADGGSWELDVAPGTYVDNDQGLLVGIETRPAT